MTRNIYTAFHRMRTALLTGLMLGAGLVILSSPVIAADDVFTVAGVKVDAKAENAVAAREKAFATAQTVAFTAIATKLLGDEEAKAYKIPDTATIAAMIKDFEVTNEQISAVEYIGTYTFRFEGNAVRNRFNMQGLKYSDVVSKPVLVLPFYQMGQVISLWRDGNPWLKAWTHADLKGGLVPINVPLGDALDVCSISDDQALDVPADKLEEMLARYGAKEAIILIAKPGKPATGDFPADLSVMIYRTDNGTPEYAQTVKVTADAGATSADALYVKAVRQVRAILQKNWKNQTMIDPAQGNIAGSGDIPAYTDPNASPYDRRLAASGPVSGLNNTITVHVQFTTMQEWVTTRQALQTVQGISDMKVRSVTPREAQVDLSFAGGIDRLRALLAQSDMVLTTDATGSNYALALRKTASY
ncbi:MAG: hypothetical protein JWO78_1389 [Micavibrio sp.]|nr:hypothetical protein [Micavibrio sp.]